MKRIAPALVLLAGLFLPRPGMVQGQEDPPEIQVPEEGEVQELRLQDGSTLFGRVTAVGDTVTFVLLSGSEMRVPRNRIRSLRTASGTVVDGEYWIEDPNRTRLFFGPTARGLPRGTGYLAVYEIVLPFLAVGVTDHFVLAGGTPFFFGGGGSRPYWLAPKLTFLDNGDLQAAAGVLAFMFEDDSAGLLYGVLTGGGAKSSYSLGIGYGYVNDDLADTPAVMVGGEFRASKHLKLITENYLFPGGEGLVSIGPRFFGERLSADLGLVMPLGGGEFFAFPLINFVWNF